MSLFFHQTYTGESYMSLFFSFTKHTLGSIKWVFSFLSPNLHWGAINECFLSFAELYVRNHRPIGLLNLTVDMCKQNLLSFDTCKQNLLSFETCKQNLLSFDTCKQNLLSFDTCKQNLLSFDTCKQNLLSFELQTAIVRTLFKNGEKGP